MQRLLAATLAAAALAEPASAKSDFAYGVAGGIAVVMPDDSSVKGYGAGGTLHLEFVDDQGQWFNTRFYTGLVLTGPRDTCKVGVSPCDLSANLFLLGGKFRVMAPFPYVGPFFELGFGVSFGRIAGHVGQVFDHEASGVFYHIPFSLGLALGSEHRFQLALQYLFHPDHSIVPGALVVGYDFPF